MGLESIDAYQLFDAEAPQGFDKSDRYTKTFLGTLENPVTNADYKLLNHPTRMLKAIRCALMRAGHGIVGDKDLVKKSKGLYAALVGITLTGSLAADQSSHKVINTVSGAAVTFTEGKVHIALPTPAKFVKLMEREERMWQAARERDQAVLTEHRSRSAISEGIPSLTSTTPAGAHGEKNDDGSDSGNSPLAVSAVVASAAADVPVEYQTGEAMFCNRRFHVSPSVMIPRRSSEALVKEAVRLACNGKRDLKDGEKSAKVVRVLDLGTGSGCLLLSTVLELQCALPGTLVTGVGLDISTDALQVAAVNVEHLNLSTEVSLVEGSFESMLEALLPNRLNTPDYALSPRQSFDIILCNPPYSSFKDKSRLSAACRMHEPAVALFAPRHTRVDVEGGTEEGTMGAYYMIARSLAAIHQHDTALRRDHSICGTTHTQSLTSNDVGVCSTQDPDAGETSTSSAMPLISVGAHLILEMGHGQESDVRRIISTGAQGWVYLHSVRDHLGLVRCVVFQYVGENDCVSCMM